MKPVLDAAKNEEVKLTDVTELLAEKFNLTKEEKTQLLPSGRQAVFKDVAAGLPGSTGK